MKKSSLLKMKNLPATEEMLAVAREDVPVKVGSGWNTFYRCRYSGFVRSAVEGGILKVTLYDPDAMRLGGTLPVYEIFMEKEKQQFLTYDRTRNEWRTAKIDYLEWQAKGSNNVWISAVDDAQIRQYLASDEKSVYRATDRRVEAAKHLRVCPLPSHDRLQNISGKVWATYFTKFFKPYEVEKSAPGPDAF